MKCQIHQILIFMFGLSMLWGENIGAISLTEYVTPVSFSQNLQLDATYNYAGQDSTTSNLGSASTDYLRFYDSQPFAYRLELKTSLNYDGLNENEHIQLDHQDIELTRNKTTMDIATNAEFRKYVIFEKFFGLVGINMRYFQGKGDYVETTVVENDTSYAIKNDSYDRPEVTISGGIGYGRSVNATPLVRAVRVQEELLRLGELMDELPKEILLRLARLLTPQKRNEYKDQYETWESYYFADIQRILLLSGLLKGDRLSPLGVVRIQQVLDENINDRFYGWDISLILQYSLLTRSEEVKREENDGFGIFARYAYPITLQTQFSHNTTIVSGIQNPFKENVVTSTSSLYYELSDRVDFRLEYGLDLTFTNSTHLDYTRHNIDSRFIFYIEKKINLNISGSLLKTIIEGASEQAWDKRLTLSLTYDII